MNSRPPSVFIHPQNVIFWKGEKMECVEIMGKLKLEKSELFFCIMKFENLYLDKIFIWFEANKLSLNVTERKKFFGLLVDENIL